jgi:hypothetical protein
MFKSVTLSLVSLLLICATLAPSLEILCASDHDTAFLLDINEEENNKKESEKEFDQTELFFLNSVENLSICLSQEIIGGKIYILSFFNFSSEIILPPPQHIT